MPTKLLLEVTYQEVARRLLLKQPEEAIAQGMGISIPALKGILSRQDFKQIFHDLQSKMYSTVDAHLLSQGRNIRDEIEQAAGASFDRLMALLKESSSESIAKDVAQDLLDRAGYGRKAEDSRTTINIGTLEAAVLVEALHKDEDGKRRLGERTVLELTKPVKEHADAIRDASEAADS